MKKGLMTFSGQSILAFAFLYTPFAVKQNQTFRRAERVRPAETHSIHFLRFAQTAAVGAEFLKCHFIEEDETAGGADQR